MIWDGIFHFVFPFPAQHYQRHIIYPQINTVALTELHICISGRKLSSSPSDNPLCSSLLFIVIFVHSFMTFFLLNILKVLRIFFFFFLFIIRPAQARGNLVQEWSSHRWVWHCFQLWVPWEPVYSLVASVLVSGFALWHCTNILYSVMCWLLC